MLNPWMEARYLNGSWVLESDRKSVRKFNERQRSEETCVLEDSIPEPFIGNPFTAKLVLLGLNPGHSDDDPISYGDPAFRDAMLLNLRHELQDFPFYPLNPLFSRTGAGRWWRPITHQLCEHSRLDEQEFARKLMVIEWFPYHSKRSGLPYDPLCESQQYSFDLAGKMLHQTGVVVIGMRSRNHWIGVNPEFEKVRFLINKHRPFVSRGNMEGGLFEQILEVLRH